MKKTIHSKTIQGDFEITIGDKDIELIDTGSVIVSVGQHLRFKIVNIKVDIVFSDEHLFDESGNERSVKLRYVNDTAYFTFGDVRNLSFSSPSYDRPVAVFGTKQLFIRMTFQSVGSSNYLFFYTFYLK